MVRPLLTYILLFVGMWTTAQTCSISSDTTVCKGELINFTASSSSTPSAYLWDFDDGSSATQSAVSHSYSTSGKKTITLITSYNGGQTCTTKVDIYVHELPNASFEIMDSVLCIGQLYNCIIDSSSMGSTTNGYSSRSILWGDGSLEVETNPVVGDTICYNEYPKPGKYSITVEVVNDKGCEDKWIGNVRVAKDYGASFSYNLKPADCKSRALCLFNDSTQTSDVESFEWDLGDGSIDDSTWTNLCHTYNTPGTYKITLTIRLKNGCVFTVAKNIKVDFVLLQLNVDQKDTVLCHPEGFRFSNPHINGALYFWELKDSAKNAIEVASLNSSDIIDVPYPGDFYVRLRLKYGNCEELSDYMLIRSVGVKPSFIPLNANQCIKQDTVYFHNISRKHSTAKPSYHWDFDDTYADSCFGYLNNCNYDSNFHSQHWYLDTGCLFPTLTVYDSVSGCIDSMPGMVALEQNTQDLFSYSLNKPCIGRKLNYKVGFDHNYCLASVRATYDSLSGVWEDFVVGRIYDTLYDPDGWVTAGFSVVTGNRNVYQSNDLQDYIEDSSRTCVDTFWQHKWFQLNPEPDSTFARIKNSCDPVIDVKYLGDNPEKLTRLSYSWDNGRNWTNVDLFEDTVPNIKAEFEDVGSKSLHLFLIDSFGCYIELKEQIHLGYFKELYVDSSICAGDTVQLIDSVRYYSDSINYWVDTLRTEKILWDLADGNGFVEREDSLELVFPNRGVYTIRMLTNDSVGCEDTVERTIYVGGIVAGATYTDTFSCNEIASFLDSSYFQFNKGDEEIVEYYWDFGAGVTPSFLKDPYYNFSSYGDHQVKHAVLTNAGCTDTANLHIYIEGPLPYFQIISDSIGCTPFTVKLKSRSKNVSQFIWHFGDPDNRTFTASTDTTIEFTYAEAGEYLIYLEGADSFYNEHLMNYYTCRSVFPDSLGDTTLSRWVKVLDYPKVDILTNDTVCVGEEWLAQSQSDTIYKNYSWFLNGIPFANDSNTIKHRFDSEGVYQLKLKPTYPLLTSEDRACYDSFELTLQVFDVKADFDIEQLNNCNHYAFLDASYNGDRYLWDLDVELAGVNTSSDRNTDFDYGLDTGRHYILLKVTSEQGCTDTSMKSVVVNHFENLEPYNVFTPGSDGLNDEFVIETVNVEDYDLKIFNRWGELVFHSTVPNQGWNGQYMNSGVLLPSSTYFYVLNYKFKCKDEQFELNGTVDLLR